MSELTGNQKLWQALRQAERAGVHSHDVIERKISYNPSQRAKDVTTKGFQVWAREERRGRSNGSRYWLDPYQPSDATRVAPNNGAEVDSPPVAVDPAPPDTLEPVAIIRDWDGKWRELPVSELGWAA